MAGRAKRKPVNISADQVIIRVRPTWGPPDMIAWIVDDWLQTAAGPPARHCEILIGELTEHDPDGSLRRKALEVLEKRGYRNIRAGAE